MSAVKIFALSSLLMTITVQSTFGERFRSANLPNTNAQNLATSSPSPGPFVTSGLFLGVTTGNLGTTSTVSSPSINLAGSLSAGPETSSTPSNSSNPAPSIVPSPAPAATVSIPEANAFINFGSAPYPEASTLTTGNALPFFDSPAFTHLFGTNGPTSTDIRNFENEVLATIKSTYNNAGLAISLTTDPNAPAAHTMSIVSGASYSGNPGAIGITDIGHDGFSFIDKFSMAQTPDQLAIAIGHNLSHELMHAFGIANHPEQTGPYVDAATTTFATLADPSTGFSPAAASLLSTLNFDAVGTSVTAGPPKIDGDQILVASAASTVPEPSTVVLWTLAGGLVIGLRRRQAA